MNSWVSLRFFHDEYFSGKSDLSTHAEDFWNAGCDYRQEEINKLEAECKRWRGLLVDLEGAFVLSNDYTDGDSARHVKKIVREELSRENNN